jgi:putative endonuclease
MTKGPQAAGKKLGGWGEQRAAEYLETKGYRILDRNVRTPYGEIDLVAETNLQLVFVEVKTRSSTRFGQPEEAIDEDKLTHMIESAESYLIEHPNLEGDWRIDVIAILLRPGREPEITHFENAVS